MGGCGGGPSSKGKSAEVSHLAWNRIQEVVRSLPSLRFFMFHNLCVNGDD